VAQGKPGYYGNVPPRTSSEKHYTRLSLTFVLWGVATWLAILLVLIPFAR
jgi:hypothetical protein